MRLLRLQDGLSDIVPNMQDVDEVAKKMGLEAHDVLLLQSNSNDYVTRSIMTFIALIFAYKVGKNIKYTSDLYTNNQKKKVENEQIRKDNGTLSRQIGLLKKEIKNTTGDLEETAN